MSPNRTRELELARERDLDKAIAEHNREEDGEECEGCGRFISTENGEEIYQGWNGDVLCEDCVENQEEEAEDE